MHYVIGVDGGGTHSTARLQALDSETNFSIEVGSINLCSNPREFVRTQLNMIFAGLWQKSGVDPNTCAAICVGSAGILSPASIDALRGEIVSIIGADIPLIVTGDMEVCLAGALKGQAGIALLSGTGSFCIGCGIQTPCVHVGGLGHVLSDEGSAYNIGRSILIAAVRAYQGRGPFTVLIDLLRQRGLSSIDEIVDYVYLGSGNKGDIASLAPLLQAACEANDEVALHILERAAVELSSLVGAVHRKLSGECPEIALCGGVLMHNELLRHRVAGLLSAAFPNVEIHLANSDAAHGAIRLARELVQNGNHKTGFLFRSVYSGKE